MEISAQPEDDVVVPRAAVSIEITSTPVLSYALAHNRIPVISRLAPGIGETRVTASGECERRRKQEFDNLHDLAP